MKKYIITGNKSYPNGHVRKMYFNRFGREEKIRIIHQDTKNKKYLKQIHDVSNFFFLILWII